MKKLTEVPYSSTMTRAQFFAQEMERLGLSEQHDFFRELYQSMWPQSDSYWSHVIGESVVVIKKEMEKELLEDQFDYCVWTMRKYIRELVKLAVFCLKENHPDLFLEEEKEK